ncbi:MAG: hypothetical protein HKO57_01375, partial [Akkermansiaceae bacterium]|nr:hypothetical protein [Akkermansiaceae bacterium]
RGVRDLSGWVKNDNWKIEGGNLTCATNGSIARPEVLPANFILRFRLRWEQNPNLRFYFCDDLLERRGDADRYYFEINTGGLQLKRQTKDGDRRWIPIASLERRPEEFADATVEIEIRVNRENRLIYFYLDGEKEGRYLDPIDDFPEGTGIMLYSLAAGDMKNVVELIEVYEWDAVSQLRRSEGHSDDDTDAIVSNTGERFSGTAERLVREGDGPRILFNSPHSDDPFRIPQRRISTLYFRSVEGSRGSGSAAFTTDWEGGGHLHLNSLQLTADKATAQHPLLGDLVLERASLRRMQVPAAEDPDDAKPPSPSK